MEEKHTARALRLADDAAESVIGTNEGRVMRLFSSLGPPWA